MRFLLLSDTHLLWNSPIGRIDNTHETQIRKLKFILDWAKEHEVAILQAGDFFDSPRSWYLLPEVMDLLGQYKVDLFVVFGQHDVYFYSQATRDATSLGILEKAGLVTVLGQHHIRFLDESGRQKINLYGASYGQDVPDIEGGADINILVLHASIAEKALWPGHDYMDARKFLQEYEDFDLILCGDIHKKFLIEEEGRVICNTGCMLRISVDLWDHKPCFYVYDTKKKLTHIEEVEIPHEVAAKVLSKSHIEKEKQITMMLDKFVKSVSNDFNIESDFTGNLWKFVKENKIDQKIVDILSEIMEEKL